MINGCVVVVLYCDVFSLEFYGRCNIASHLLFVCLYLSVFRVWHVYGGQRATFRNRFSLCTVGSEDQAHVVRLVWQVL